MPVRQKDAQRALELLQQYRLRLDQRHQSPGAADEDQQLNSSLDRVISVFQSQLFNALLDIQEYYELTIMADCQSSGVQPEHVPSSAPSSVPSSVPSSAPLSPTASGESSKPKISPKPKSPAPPIPTGLQSPTATAPPLQSQSSKKYRAPPPPANSRSTPAPAPGDQTHDREKEAQQNGVREFDLSDPSCEYSTISPLPPVTPGEQVTVSALISSSVQGLLPSSSDGKGASGDSAPKTTSPVSNSKEAALQKGTAAVQSPTGSAQARFTFSGLSPTISPGPFAKGPLLSPKGPGSGKLFPVSPAHGPVSPAHGPVSPAHGPVSPAHGPVSPRTVQAPKTPVKQINYQNKG
ncbi:uncharacterized protein [Eucyclogobius newberryi]|uniref:uncharacterized protein n=1 Tax=Eucyclogobius newberryi TaxID=166745 RepID=UPI003B5AB792